MKRPREFRPDVDFLESRSMLSALIYTDASQNAEQAAYAAQAQLAENPVVFFGDSITYRWQTSGSSAFLQDFAPLRTADFGIPGDTTTGLIARVQAGDFAGKPKVAVVMIGINDLGQGKTPLQTATGVLEVVQSIEAASPQTKILLLGVLPTDVPYLNPLVQQLDGYIAAIGKLPGVVYENPGALFLGSNGEAAPGLTVDGVHPSAAGYDLLAGAIDATVLDLLEQADASTVRSVAVPSLTHKIAPIATPSIPATNAETALLIPPVPTPVTPAGIVTTDPTTKPRSYATELITVPTS